MAENRKSKKTENPPPNPFDRLMGALVQVPKEELDRERERDRQKKTRTPRRPRTA